MEERSVRLLQELCGLHIDLSPVLHEVEILVEGVSRVKLGI